MCGGGGGDIIDVITDPVTIITVVAAGILAPGATFSMSAALWAGGSIVAAALFAPSMPELDLTIGADKVTQGRNVSVRQPVAPWRVIYGQCRAGGIFVEMITTASEYLHVFAVMACHEVDSFTKLYLDDKTLTVGTSPFTTSASDSNSIPIYEVTAGDFFDSDSKIRWKFHTGTTTQLADANGVSDITEWTSSHRLRNHAYMYGRMKFHEDIFANGMPGMSAEVKGAKVYDPRDSSTAWSNNPALCVRDFLLNTRYGLKVSAGEINDSTTTVGGFGYAAARCEDTINSNNRYECNGIFDLAQSPKQILDLLLSSCSGKLIYQNGKFNIYVGYHSAPTITLIDKDFIEPVQIVTKLGRKDIFNRIAGTFYDSSNDYIVQEFDPIASTQYKSDDNGEEITADVEFNFTTSATKARELCLIELLKVRQQIAMTCTTSLERGLQIQCGDFVNVTLSNLGFSSKIFEVQEWSLNSANIEGEPTLVCNMMLREADPNVYTNSVLSDIAASKEISTDPNINTTFADATSVTAPTNLTLTDKTGGVVEAVWLQDGVMSQFQLEYKLSSDSSYIEQVMPGHNRRFTIQGLTTSQTYNFRIKAINSTASSSSYVTANITL
jgi:hypothetical protein